MLIFNGRESFINIFHIYMYMGQQSGAVVSTAASQQESSESDFTIWLGPFLCGLRVLLVFVWVLSGYSGFLPHELSRLG